MKKTKVAISPVITEIRESSEQDGLITDHINTPVLALRDSIIFPGITTPVSIGREKSLQLVKYAEDNKVEIALFTQKTPDCEDPGYNDLYHTGVTGQVVKVIEMPDNTVTAIIHARKITKLDSINSDKPFLQGSITDLNESIPSSDDEEMNIAVELVKETYEGILKTLPENEANELSFAMKNFNNPLFLINFLCVNSPLPVQVKQHLLEITDLKKRVVRLNEELCTALKFLNIKMEMQERTREDLTRQQREHFLQQQMRNIQDELGMSPEDNDGDELRTRAEKMSWSNDMEKFFNKELRKLDRYNPQSPEYAIQYQYLDTLLSLPWQQYSQDSIQFSKSEKRLNKDHYGLEEVKDRILEQLAVISLRKDMKAPILCLYGPPGVGKTSLGKSIAEAMGREYVRISLGGLHDEAEIRGHRRTYIGAMPGRIMASMLKVKTSNPVIVLDEIDKIGSDFKGDPSTALLEVLDPEQNVKFHDNYIDVDYDLSHAMFIATANSLSTISRPLLDRMELIEINGYTAEEKVEIARRHLIGKALEENGFKPKEISFKSAALRKLVDSYTRESGVRQLDKKISQILRKIARLMVGGKPYPKIITEEKIRELLGPDEYTPDMYENNDTLGVVTGLAWTQVGGEILFIESSLSSGKGEKLTLTGNLGDVMKESAIIAMQYLKANANELGIDPERFTNNDVHIHVPEGAIPKDGPSAGVTMITSLASSFTKRKVKPHLAMTGEITLRGKVLPVGGIKEKILAAKRAGIKEIILCSKNKKDIDKINPDYLEGLTFRYVDRISEVLDIALI